MWRTRPIATTSRITAGFSRRRRHAVAEGGLQRIAEWREGGFWMSGAGHCRRFERKHLHRVGQRGFRHEPHAGNRPGRHEHEAVFHGQPRLLSRTTSRHSTRQPGQQRYRSRIGWSAPASRSGAARHPHELVQAGKEGTIYVINRDQMTAGNQHYCSGCASDTQIEQELQTEVGGMWSMPAYWNNNVYFWGIRRQPGCFLR